MTAHAVINNDNVCYFKTIEEIVQQQLWSAIYSKYTF